MIQRAKLRRRLEVDFLEERRMLSVSWTNPSGGDWDDPNNWSTKVLPGANDDVVINVAGGVTITHSQNAADSVQSITASNPLVLSRGTLDVAGTLDDTSPVTVSGGTLADAAVTSGTTIDTGTPGSSRTTGTLRDVTLAGTLNYNTFSDTINIAGAGLALAGGTITIGQTGYLNFSGTQTLGGTGTVTLGGGANVTSYIDVNGTGDLTIGSGITVDAPGSGQINAGNGVVDNQGTIDVDGSNGSSFSITSGVAYGSAGGSVVNHGLIEDTSGTYCALDLDSSLSDGATWSNQGTITIRGQSLPSIRGPWTNDGVIQVLDGGDLDIEWSCSIDGEGVLESSTSSTITVEQGFTYGLLGDTRNAGLYNPAGVTIFEGSQFASSALPLEAMSRDLGPVAAGFNQNFAYGSLDVYSGNVQLVNRSVNSGGTGPEAVYASSVVVSSGGTLDLAGLHLYARAAQVSGTVVNGSITLVPKDSSIVLGQQTPGAVAAAGASDDWTLYGRAGHSYSIVVDPGNPSPFSSGAVVPIAPQLGLAKVQLLDASGDVLGTASSASPGGLATLSSVAVPADGTYRIRVQAAGPYAGSLTGNYLVTASDVTQDVLALELGQLVNGDIENPSRVDRWQFTGAAGQQVQFDLLNSTSPGLKFTLSGPSGFTGFTDIAASSGPIDLTASGAYTLTVQAVGTERGEYAFRLDATQQTAVPLALGTPYDGTLVGDAEAQLFRVNVPQSQQFLVSLQGISAADHVEVYARFGSPPTRDDTQYAATAPATTGEDVLVPMAAPGTWYILVYAETVGTPPEGFTLTAGVAPMTLASVSPARLGNADDATLTLTGAGFDPATTVSLNAADGTVYPAGRVQLDLPTQLTATFAAGSVPAGVYSVLVARSDGASATLAGAFTVEQAGQADFHINLVTPGELGYHIASTIYVQYSNTGNLAMPAPLVEVTIAQTHADGTTDQEALLTLDPSLVTQGLWTATLPAGFSNTIQFLASGANPGVLEPGESIQVPIYYAGWEQPWDNTYPDFQYEYGVEQTTDTTPIPWDTVQQEFQPADLDTTAWDAVLPGVETLVGNTWGDFVQALDDNASYLGHLGEDVTDIYQLWNFEIQQAGGLSPVKVLSSRTDLQVVTPGPAHRSGSGVLQLHRRPLAARPLRLRLDLG